MIKFVKLKIDTTVHTKLQTSKSLICVRLLNRFLTLYLYWIFILTFTLHTKK